MLLVSNIMFLLCVWINMVQLIICLELGSLLITAVTAEIVYHHIKFYCKGNGVMWFVVLEHKKSFTHV